MSSETINGIMGKKERIIATKRAILALYPKIIGKMDKKGLIEWSKMGILESKNMLTNIKIVRI